MGSLRSQVRRDQRFLNVFECRSIERGTAGQAGQIVRDPFRRLLETAAPAIAPTPAHSRVFLSSVARGDARAPDLAALRAFDLHRRESITGALSVILDEAPPLCPD